MDFLIRSGRAVLFPEYQGTFERRQKNSLGPSGEREQMIEQCKDLQRSLDYLETHTDIARGQLGTPGRDKRNVLLDTGHVGPTHQYVKETLDWFDRYLGPVSRYEVERFPSAFLSRVGVEPELWMRAD